MDSMDFTMHKEVEIPSLHKTVNSYVVEQILQGVESISESYYSDGDEEKSSTEG